MPTPPAVHVEDETTLVAALRRRDERAFERLVHRDHATLVRLARTFVREQATAEEVAQDTWVGFLEGLDRFEGRSTVRTYLCTITANRARTRAVRDARTAPLSTLAEAIGGDDAVGLERFLPADHDRWPRHWGLAGAAAELPERRLLRRETLGVIAAAVRGLPERQRRVFLLHDVAGLATHETCAALALSEANRRVLLHRARRCVRTALENHLGRETTAG